MTDAELGWIAGFLDGEGTFIIVRQHKGNAHRPGIAACNTWRPAIERLATFFATCGGKGAVCKKQRRPEHQQQYVVQIGSRSGCLRVLLELDGLLVVKERQAELMRRWLLTGDPAAPAQMAEYNRRGVDTCA